jgi:hypothetical protein
LGYVLQGGEREHRLGAGQQGVECFRRIHEGKLTTNEHE